MLTPKNRKRLFEQLKIDEGVVHHIYLDHLGYPTFGVGHLITEKDPEHGMDIDTPVSEERVEEAFKRDMEICELECEILFGVPTWNEFPGEVKEILANMMFNMGRPRLRGFIKFRKALQNHDWKTAAAEGRDSRWYRQVTNRAERLMTRLENLS